MELHSRAKPRTILSVDLHCSAGTETDSELVQRIRECSDHTVSCAPDQRVLWSPLQSAISYCPLVSIAMSNLYEVGEPVAQKRWLPHPKQIESVWSKRNPLRFQALLGFPEQIRSNVWTRNRHTAFGRRRSMKAGAREYFAVHVPLSLIALMSANHCLSHGSQARRENTESRDHDRSIWRNSQHKVRWFVAYSRPPPPPLPPPPSPSGNHYSAGQGSYPSKLSPQINRMVAGFLKD